MKSVPVVFSSSELKSMRLANRSFSLTRFKAALRHKLKEELPTKLREFSHVDSVEITRIAIRGLGIEKPQEFQIEASGSFEDGTRWRQMSAYVFRSRQTLSGDLVFGRFHRAK